MTLSHLPVGARSPSWGWLDCRGCPTSNPRWSMPARPVPVPVSLSLRPPAGSSRPRPRPLLRCQSRLVACVPALFAFACHPSPPLPQPSRVQFSWTCVPPPRPSPLRLPTPSIVVTQGLRPTRREFCGRLVLGDVITSVDEKKISNDSDLYKILDRCEAGDTVKLEVLRGDRKVGVDVTLAPRD